MFEHLYSNREDIVKHYLLAHPFSTEFISLNNIIRIDIVDEEITPEENRNGFPIMTDKLFGEERGYWIILVKRAEEDADKWLITVYKYPIS